MIGLVIFDMDGTLLNSIEDLAAACNQALQKRNFPLHTVKEYQYFVGDGMTKLVERCLPAEVACQPDKVAEVLQDFLRYYQQHGADYSRPYDGIAELLQQLAARNIAVAVASNKRQNALEPLLRHYFPDVTWQAAFGQREGVPVKPHPQIVYDILEKTQVAADEVLYLGDTAVDMQTADAAGVKKVAVLWGYRTRAELGAAGATTFIAAPEELLPLLQ